MKTKTIKPKLAKLDILCSKSDWYKERQYIQFRDGFAVTTDGHVLARWKHGLGEGSGLIHFSQYKQFRKLPGPHDVTADGLSACSGKVVFPWAEGINYPEWESVFDFKEASFQRETIVDLMRFALIQKAFKQFIEGGFGVMLCERKNNHLIYPYHGKDFIAVLMKMTHLENGPTHEPQALYNLQPVNDYKHTQIIRELVQKQMDRLNPPKEQIFEDQDEVYPDFEDDLEL